MFTCEVTAVVSYTDLMVTRHLWVYDSIFSMVAVITCEAYQFTAIQYSFHQHVSYSKTSIMSKNANQ